MKNKRIKVLYIVFFIASIFFAAFVLAEFRKDYLAVALAAVVMLIAAYLLVDKIEHDIFQRYDLDKRSLYDRIDEVTQEIRRGNDKIEVLSEIIMKATRQGLTDPKQDFNQLSEALAAIEQTLQNQEDIIKQQNFIKESAKNLERIGKTQRETIALLKTGFKTIIQFSKENSRQIAVNSNQNSDQLLKELTLLIQQFIDDIPKILADSLAVFENKIDSMSEAYVENISLVSSRLETIEEIINEITKSTDTQ